MEVIMSEVRGSERLFGEMPNIKSKTTSLSDITRSKTKANAQINQLHNEAIKVIKDFTDNLSNKENLIELNFHPRFRNSSIARLTDTLSGVIDLLDRKIQSKSQSIFAFTKTKDIDELKRRQNQLNEIKTELLIRQNIAGLIENENIPPTDINLDDIEAMIKSNFPNKSGKIDESIARFFKVFDPKNSDINPAYQLIKNLNIHKKNEYFEGAKKAGIEKVVNALILQKNPLIMKEILIPFYESLNSEEKDQFFEALKNVDRTELDQATILMNESNLKTASEIAIGLAKAELKDAQRETLFRETSWASTAMTKMYRAKVLPEWKEIFISIYTKTAGMHEIDMERGKSIGLNSKQIFDNQRFIKKIAQEILTDLTDNLKNNPSLLPPEVRTYHREFYHALLDKFQDEELAKKMTINMFFLRFLCPLISSPPAKEVLGQNFKSTRDGITVARILQNIANEISSFDRNHYLHFISGMFEDNQTNIEEIFNALIKR